MSPSDLIRPGRRITGMSAVLLPFADGAPDLASLTELVGRTVEAGLAPAVNMDTGYGNLLSPEQRSTVLAATVAAAGDSMVIAGAWVDDQPGAAWDPTAQAAAVEAVAAAGAVPVVVPHHGLFGLDEVGVVAAHEWVGRHVDRFIGFELGQMFSPAGRIWEMETYRAIMRVPACIGAKHSSLHRQPEWDRLRARDEDRPEFMVLTGNDLAIDMVTYGSDYLLGLSAFAPDLFAKRDAMWAAGDPDFHELNDDLQALGSFAFRSPVPAYKHDAALLLHHRGWLASTETPAGAVRRPDADAEVLASLWSRLERWTA